MIRHPTRILPKRREAKHLQGLMRFTRAKVQVCDFLLDSKGGGGGYNTTTYNLWPGVGDCPMLQAKLWTTSESLRAKINLLLRAVIGTTLVISILGPIAIAAVAIFRTDRASSGDATWQAHREWCRSLPEELYHQDRWRAVRGYVTDHEGQPIEGVHVQCINLDAILALARRGMPAPDAWQDLVEAETSTDARGHYEFPHLPIGARTFCYSADGRAPAVQELIVVQDGVGARLDVKLEAPRILSVEFVEPADAGVRLSLIPFRWWPEPISQDVASGDDAATFTGLGGPFQKGLIAVVTEGSVEWRVVGRYDIDESATASISPGDDAEPTRFPLLELECLRPFPSTPSPSEGEGRGEDSPWADQLTAAHRLFYATISPTALFWSNVPPPETPSAGTSTIRGFGPNPFLPVLVESESGDAWFGLTSDASEFEFSGLPPGYYRMRTWRYFGQQTFSRGVFVRPNAIGEVRTGIYEHIDFDELRSREVMGFVVWENAEPAKNTQVFMQDATNFRRFLQRVTTDEHGFFRVPNVPADAPYFMFALPADDRTAIKNFVHPTFESSRREVWQGLTVFPHRVVGELADAPGAQIDLFRQDAGADRVVWTFYADNVGKFEISNVPHGIYRLVAKALKTNKVFQSRPFEVSELGKTTVTDWTSSGG